MAEFFPLISVIIPSFNKGNLILATVESVKANDYQGKHEIVIIDDYSTDSVTKEAYKTIQKKYPETRIEESGGKGPGNARNKGTQLARGEYLVFLDNDDLISPNFLQESYLCLKNQDASCAYVYGDTVVFGAYTGWRPTPVFSPEQIRILNYVPVTCFTELNQFKKAAE